MKFFDGDVLFKVVWEYGIILCNLLIENCVCISVGNCEECEKIVVFICNYY